MSYNLKKIAVGIKSIERLKIRQQMLFENYGAIVHTTRNMPKQKADLIKTGSMYWIIQRNVLVRQKILDIKPVIRSDGSKGCEIELDQDLIKVMNECFKEKCSPPFIGFGHSMGGCLLASYLISEQNCLDKCILCAPMISVRANAVSRRLVKILGVLDIFGFGSFPMQKPSWNEKMGWQEESFEDNALTTDEDRFKRTFHLLEKFPELGVKGITVGWLKHALKRTNDFKQINWGDELQTPLLLLDATQDKLVNSQLNKELLSQSNLTKVVSIEAQHEIMMEQDQIRAAAWKAIDNFLSS